MKVKNELKMGIVLTYIYLVLNNITQIIYTPFMLNKMGQAEYGVYSLCMSIVNYLTILDFGLGNAVIKYVAESKAKSKIEQNKVNWLFFKIYLFLGIIAIILGGIIAINVQNIFSQALTPDEIRTSRIIIGILTLNVGISLPLSVFLSITVAYNKFIFTRLLNIVKVLLLPAVMIPLLLLGYKAIAMSLVVSIIGTLSSIVIALYAIIKLKVRFEFKKVEKGLIKEITTFSIFAFLLLIVDKINWNVDQIIIGMYISSEAVAIYSVASHIFQLYLTFPSVISGVLLPKLTEVKNDDCANNDIFRKTSRIQLLMAIYILFRFYIGRETIY